MTNKNFKTYALVVNTEDELDIETTTSTKDYSYWMKKEEFKNKLLKDIKFLQDFIDDNLL